jgi:hypothetical protein
VASGNCNWQRPVAGSIAIAIAAVQQYRLATVPGAGAAINKYYKVSYIIYVKLLSARRLRFAF